MSDKQIIIDGVDVSGCEYIIPPHKQCPNKPMPYAKETSCFACKEHNTKLNFCKNNPNCNYKNWQRKEQECEELKEAQKNSRCAWKSLEGTFCPQAQEQLEAYKMEADEGKEINAELKAENDELKVQNIKYMNGNIGYQLKNSLYKQTLTEIKELIQSDYCTEIGSCEFCAEIGDCLNRKILQKISECEE